MNFVKELELETLYPAPVRVVMRRMPEAELPVAAEEQAAILRAGPKRRRDFSAGRACAHDALVALGSPARALPRNDDGSVAWPEGVAGSITHSRRWCAAVVGWRRDVLGLGLDIEETGRLSEGGAKLVLSETERLATRRSALGEDACRTLMFSAKEAIYKALHPTVRRYIDFTEAVIEVEDDGRLQARLVSKLEASLPTSSRLTGRYYLFEGSVLTAMTLTRQESIITP